MAERTRLSGGKVIAALLAFAVLGVVLSGAVVWLALEQQEKLERALKLYPKNAVGGGMLGAEIEDKGLLGRIRGNDAHGL